MDAGTTQKSTEQNSTVWSNELANPEVQEALATLIQKLPQIKEAVDKAEQGIAAASAFVSDTDSINYLAERLDRFTNLALTKENMEALTVIIESLPRIAKTVALLDRISSAVEPLIEDKDSLAYITDTVDVVAAPVKERIQEGTSIVKEAKERAERDTSTISIFGVMKMLKDPAVQKGLKFTQALLHILSEKKIIK